jgi:YVTN family beta-propeller protein
MNSAKILKVFFIIFFMYSYNLFSQPVVLQNYPKVGPTIGGNAVNIQGNDFTGASAVFFGSKPAVSFSVINDSLITAIAPPETPKTINIFITTPTGTSSVSKASSYTYQGFWFAYTTQFSSNTVVPINTNSNIPSASIIVGNSPSSVAITPDGTTAYINVSGANSTVAIDIATNTIIGLPIPVGSNPQGIAISPDGRMVYTANYGSHDVTPIDLTTNPPTPMTPIPAGANPLSIAITPNGQFAYVVNTSIGNVTIIDLTSQTPLLTTTITGGRPVAVIASPNGTRVYVTGVQLNLLREISTSTNTIVRVTALPGPGLNALTITSDASKLFITNTFDASITPFDLVTNTAGPNIVSDLRPDAIALTSDQTRAYVAHEQSNNVGIIDLTLTPPVNTLYIPVGSPTGDITVTPDQAPFAFFTTNLAPAGISSTFDASDSVSPVGSIASYSWDFGDGTTIVTTTPIITHTYTNAGIHTVTLIVTNTAGTSLLQVFTGQTVRNNGGSNAIDVQSINILFPPPILTNLTPNSGFAPGGNQITITGLNFTDTIAVLFGSTSATNFTVLSDTTIVVTVPPGIGVVDVTVVTPFGITAITLADQYKYISLPPPVLTNLTPNSGFAPGGNQVTITGLNFTGTAAVLFGSTPATNFTVLSDTTIVATVPPGIGVVNITIITPFGTTAIILADQYTYVSLPPPVLTNLTPNSGFTPGGNQVTITGLNFTGTTAVLFGSTPATNFTVLSDTTIVATVPPGIGVVNVTVVTLFGTTTITLAYQYIYVLSINPTPLPPTGFRGIIEENNFLNKTEYVLKLKWHASISANIILYRIYKDGKLIKEISAQSHLLYALYVHSKNTHKDYEISAVDTNNLESSRIKARIKVKH